MRLNPVLKSFYGEKDNVLPAVLQSDSSGIRQTWSCRPMEMCAVSSIYILIHDHDFLDIEFTFASQSGRD